MGEAQAAFDDLKQFLVSPPVLTSPLEKEDLLLYITATTNVVSTAIIVEREEDCRCFILAGFSRGYLESKGVRLSHREPRT